jgi:DNA topoisomerase I
MWTEPTRQADDRYEPERSLKRSFFSKLLGDLQPARTRAEARKNVRRAVERVAGRLGNTVAICRKCYVHPVVFDAYLDGTLLETLQQRLDHEVRAGEDHLQPEEMAVLALLHRRLDREKAAAGNGPARS